MKNYLRNGCWFYFDAEGVRLPIASIDILLLNFTLFPLVHSVVILKEAKLERNTEHYRYNYFI